MLKGDNIDAIGALLVTVALGVLFTYLQYREYVNAPFSISDGVYGRTFFIATGFHGLHVVIGTIFIIVRLARLCKEDFTVDHHFGFEARAWY